MQAPSPHDARLGEIRVHALPGALDGYRISPYVPSGRVSSTRRSLNESLCRARTWIPGFSTTPPKDVCLQEGSGATVMDSVA